MGDSMRWTSVLVGLVMTGNAAAAPSISKSVHGKVEGKPVDLYTLENSNGLVLKVSSFGAIITELRVPDRAGKLADVVLGYDSLADYVADKSHFGGAVGRVANRIRDARFALEGKRYTVAANNPPHHLHGGVKGWDKVVWNAQTQKGPEGPSIALSYVSKDGEEGYPGTVKVTTTYTLTNKNELRVFFEATTDKVTLVNVAQHTYWNLAGHDSGTILDHELALHAARYTPGDPVPTGEVKPVKGTPFDFTVAKRIGKDLRAAAGNPVGYDLNFIIDGEPGKRRPVARLKDPRSGRVLTLESDQPGVQFYTGNFLDGTSKGKGATYRQYSGLCLETQKFPNAINIPAWQDQVILRPGQTYRHTMVHRFTTE